MLETVDESIDEMGKYKRKLDSFISVGNELVKQVTNCVPGMEKVDLIGIGKDIEENKKYLYCQDSPSFINDSVENRIKELKNDFAKKLNDLTKVSDNKIVIMIDELDRCRPTFAIELLEIIKHFFDTGKYLFILSVCMKQLRESVRQIYGNNFEEDGYFRRFIDYEFSLPLPSQDNLNEFFLKNIRTMDSEDNYSFFQFYQIPFIKQDISLRKGQKIIKFLDLLCRVCQQSSFYNTTSKIYLAFGIYLKFMIPNLFNSVVIKKDNSYQISESEKDNLYKSFAFTKQYYTDSNQLSVNTSSLEYIDVEEFLFALFNMKNDYVLKKTASLRMNLLDSRGEINRDYMMINRYIVDGKSYYFCIDSFNKNDLDSILSFYG